MRSLLNCVLGKSHSWATDAANKNWHVAALPMSPTPTGSSEGDRKMWPQRPDGAATGGLLSLANWLGCDSCTQSRGADRKHPDSRAGFHSTAVAGIFVSSLNSFVGSSAREPCHPTCVYAEEELDAAWVYYCTACAATRADSLRPRLLLGQRQRRGRWLCVHLLSQPTARNKEHQLPNDRQTKSEITLSLKG